MIYFQKVWFLVTGAALLKKRNPNVYKNLLEQYAGKQSSNTKCIANVRIPQKCQIYNLLGH